MTAQLDAHADRSPHAVRYGTYVGRVGALALRSESTTMATGHGLGLGVAYATEGDPSTDTSQGGGDDGSDENGAGVTSSAPSTGAVQPGATSKPRSPLARIASVPRMIFNATGGAQQSSGDTAPRKLPKLRGVVEDVATVITGNLTGAITPHMPLQDRVIRRVRPSSAVRHRQ